MKRRGRPPHPDILTPREWEVLEHLRHGLTNEQIAERLGVTIHAARYHVSEILSKLNVPSREEAARWQPAPEPASRGWSLSRFGFAVLGAGVVTTAAVGLTILAVGSLNASTGSDAEAPTPRPSPVRQDPDGRPATVPGAVGRIATISDRDGIDRLYVVNVNDPINRAAQISPQLVLTPITAGLPKSDIDLSSPRWSPDAGTIAYLVHETVSDRYTLRLIAPNGEDLRLLATLHWDDRAPDCGGGEQLAWSPDGHRLAVYSRGDGLLVIDVSSGKQAKIEDAAGPGISWSPDGDRIVYVTHETPDEDELQYDVAPGCRITITESGGGGDRNVIAKGQGPAWSPDGALIAFGRDGELYVIDADGDKEHKLTDWAIGELLPDTDRKAFTTRWSPDSTRVVVDRKPTFDTIIIGTDLNAPADCGGVPEIVLDENGQPVFDENNNVVFITPTPIPNGLYASCSTGGMTGANPRWSPDSNWVAYLDSQSSDERLFIIPWTIGAGMRMVAVGAEFDWAPE